MKKIFLVAISVLVVNAINAQTMDVSKSKVEVSKSRVEATEAKAERDVEALKALSLTDEQKKKVHDFSIIKINKLRGIRAKNHSQDGTNNQTQTKSEVDAVMNEYKSNVKSILTPSQIEKYNAM